MKAQQQQHGQRAARSAHRQRHTGGTNRHPPRAYAVWGRGTHSHPQSGSSSLLILPSAYLPYDSMTGIAGQAGEGRWGWVGEALRRTLITYHHGAGNLLTSTACRWERMLPAYSCREPTQHPDRALFTKGAAQQ